MAWSRSVPRYTRGCLSGRPWLRPGTRFLPACLPRHLQAWCAPGWRSFFKSRLGRRILLRMHGPRLEPRQTKLAEPNAYRVLVHSLPTTGGPPLREGRRIASAPRGGFRDQAPAPPARAARPFAPRSGKADGPGFCVISGRQCPPRYSGAPSRSRSDDPCRSAQPPRCETSLPIPTPEPEYGEPARRRCIWPTTNEAPTPYTHPG